MSSDNKFDVIFHWGELTSWLGQDWRKHFKHGTEDVLLPRGSVKSFESYQAALRAKYPPKPNSKGIVTWNPISSAIKDKGWNGEGIRIGAIGFSQTCIGLATLLESKDAGALDFVFACDGIHRIWPSWKSFAKLAAFGTSGNPNIAPTDHCLVITHSETSSGSPTIPSTKQTATEIAMHVMAEPVFTDFVDIPELKDAEHAPISTTCNYAPHEKYVYKKVPGDYNTKVGNFYVFGYKNLAKTCNDHIYQSKVIGPRVLQHILLPRWNNNPRTGGKCVVI